MRSLGWVVILVLLPGALLLAGCGGAGDQAGERANEPSGDSESVTPETSTSSGDAGEQVFVADGSYVQVPPTELWAMS